MNTVFYFGTVIKANFFLKKYEIAAILANDREELEEASVANQFLDSEFKLLEIANENIFLIGKVLGQTENTRSGIASEKWLDDALSQDLVALTKEVKEKIQVFSKLMPSSLQEKVSQMNPSFFSIAD